MKLLVISHTPHYRKDNQITAWGPTVKEIDSLTEIFEKITHVAPLHTGVAPQASLPYFSGNISFRFISPAGGESFRNKLSLLAKLPRYLKIIVQELKDADAVHVRCPANISLIAIIVLALMKHPKSRWVKYAGNWNPKIGEPQSYRFQRWWLRKNLHKGVVTVNGEWPDQPPHIISFYNPSLNQFDLKDGIEKAASKYLKPPYQILFAGALETYKGVYQLLEIADRLRLENINFRMEIVGDGTERTKLEIKTAEMNLSDRIHFEGWRSKGEMGRFYEKAHFLLVPSNSEGWPKVISEAMAYGVVPLASAVSCIPQYLKKFKTGKAYFCDDIQIFSDGIRSYIRNPDIWKMESENAVESTGVFSYSFYLIQVKKLLSLNG